MQPLASAYAEHGGVLRYRQIEYHRMPLAAYLAVDDPRALKRNDFVRLGLVTGAGPADARDEHKVNRLLDRHEEARGVGSGFPGADVRRFEATALRAGRGTGLVARGFRIQPAVARRYWWTADPTRQGPPRSAPGVARQTGRDVLAAGRNTAARVFGCNPLANRVRGDLVTVLQASGEGRAFAACAPGGHPPAEQQLKAAVRTVSPDNMRPFNAGQSRSFGQSQSPRPVPTAAATVAWPSLTRQSSRPRAIRAATDKP